MAYESDWCGIVTIKELVDEIKAAGFRTMRIPMSWHNHVSEDENYIHYDNSPNYMYHSPEYVERSKAYVAATWLQLAAKFAEYDDLPSMEWQTMP